MYINIKILDNNKKDTEFTCISHPLSKFVIGLVYDELTDMLFDGEYDDEN